MFFVLFSESMDLEHFAWRSPDNATNLLTVGTVDSDLGSRLKYGSCNLVNFCDTWPIYFTLHTCVFYQQWMGCDCHRAHDNAQVAELEAELAAVRIQSEAAQQGAADFRGANEQLEVSCACMFPVSHSCSGHTKQKQVSVLTDYRLVFDWSLFCLRKLLTRTLWKLEDIHIRMQ